MSEEINNSAPTWANFKPPVMTTPFSSGGSLNVDGSTAAPVPTDPPTNPVPVNTESVAAPVSIEPPVAAPVPAPTTDSAIVNPDPQPPTYPASTVQSSDPVQTDQAPAPVDPSPVVSTASDPDPVTPVEVAPPTNPASVPEEVLSLDTNPTSSPVVPPMQPEPSSAPVSNPPANSWTTLTPETVPTPVVTPLTPTPAVPVPTFGSDPAVVAAPETPAPVLPDAAASSVPPVSNDSVKKGSKKLPIMIGAVAAVALLVAAAGAYVYLTKFATQPSSALGAQTTAANQAILNSSLGPDSWENDYSTSLLAVERGGLELVVTDPAPKAVPVPAATTSAVPASRSDIASLKVTIAKAEVHLATQTVAAQTVNLQATQSANRTIDRWETLRLNDSTTVDLMDLRARGGAPSSLGVTYLAAGHYTEMRLYITQAIVTFTDGSKKTLDLTSDNGVIKIAKPFDITTTGTATLLADFDAPNSVAGFDQAATFNPVLARILYNGNPL